MSLKPELIEALSGKIANSFTVKELDAIMLKTTGQGLFQVWVAPNQPIRETAFDLIQEIGRRGVERVVLAEMLARRPQNAFLAAVIDDACPEARHALPPTGLPDEVPITGPLDANQHSLLKSLQRAGKSCLEHLEKIKCANQHIVDLVKTGDLVWKRVAAAGYNQVCRHLNGEDTRELDDAYLSKIQASDDLKLVCDERHYLGEEKKTIFKYVHKLDRHGISATHYDDFAEKIRDAVTDRNRSPDELGKGVEAAIPLGTEAFVWGEIMLGRKE